MLVFAAVLGAAALERGRARADGERALADALPHFVWTASVDGRLESLSQGFFEYTRQPGPLDPDSGWGEALHPDDAERVRSEWREALHSGNPFETAARLRGGAQGAFRMFSVRAAPVRDGSGHVARWAGTWSDVDERARSESLLREADRRKDQFLSVLGHELRNPLAAIRTALQITALRDASVEQSASARRVIERQVEHMVRLIDDLLDVNRVIGGQVALDACPVDVGEALRAAVQEQRTSAVQRRQTLTLDAPAPVIARADRTRLEQVFVNLLGNAMKYSEPGGTVAVSLAREGHEAVVRFRDTGIGIAPADLSRVFEPFVQLDPERARRDGGLGIGLTLVRHLVELHGGRAEVASEGRGLGSEFTVRLPALPAVTETQPGARLYRARPRAEGRRILVVDDNVDSAQSLATLLEIQGNEVRTARDGLEGLEVAEHFRPDVVLLDLGMPRMDGFEAARRLRERDWAQGVLVVALTGWSHDEDRARSREAGFDHHMVKPVDPHALHELLRSRRGSSPATVATARRL